MPRYPVVAQIIDMAAPGANTDILPDFTLPHEGVQEVTIDVTLQNAGKVNLIMKPGPTSLGAAASGVIQAIAGSLLADADYFTVKDGTHTVLFEFERVRAATGTITTGTGANVTAGKVITIDDGVNDPVVFEFVEAAEDIADPANVPVVFAGTETAAEMRDILLAAIAGAIEDELLDLTAETSGAASIALENLLAGTVGNVAITEDIVHASYVVAGMSGGLGTVGVTGGRTAVTVDPAATAAEVAEAIVDAVNGVGAGLTMTAEVDGDDATKVNLENDAYGSAGNIANTENVANAGFTVSGMTGGYGGDVTATLDINGAANLAAEALYSKTYTLPSGYLYNLQLTVNGIIRSLQVSSKQ